MSRPREFDETVVVEAAMNCFWEDGYGATSVRALTDRTGLTGASLYNAFGDKHALFHRTLRHYIDHNTAARIRRFEANHPPREAIIAFLEDIVERSLADERRRGCLLVNSALDVAPHDAELARTVADGLRLLEDFFSRMAAAGQQAGSISRAHPPEDLGRAMLGALVAVRVLARSRPERPLLEGLLRPTLSLLDAAPGEQSLPS